MSEAIPRAVLDMLAEKWRTSGGYSAFDSVFSDDRRKADPSFYFHRKDSPDGDVNGVRAREVAALSAAGVLGAHIRDRGESYAVNEHAHHALTDFCSEVYEAWERFQERLSRIPPR